MDKKNKNPNVPNLRFSSFTDLFRLYTLKDVLQRVSIPVNVQENKLEIKESFGLNQIV